MTADTQQFTATQILVSAPVFSSASKLLREMADALEEISADEIDSIRCESDGATIELIAQVYWRAK